ncbi:hypothetical protein GIB67_019571 [Kingdonia uniflora]|uniref:Uncharacterized protein n=1 Tax=Kingdonia uniflora TaxID=39325 RepID=A0A7J7N0A9_9MAGN|nr:hypothetical protein GIB67_019571 [Kingdonia uniflora]
MGSINIESIVHSKLLSSVVPGRVTGQNVVQELSDMDLLMKLHYLKGYYFFKSSSVQGLTIFDLKKPMFTLLDHYFMVSGRIRKFGSGRPYIKCNDSGIRIVEAWCNMNLEKFLEMKDYSLHEHLVPNQVLGPELAFSPLVLIQFTWFTCGGISVGLSWAHVLGDAFSASNFMKMWGQIMAGSLQGLPKSQAKPQYTKNKPSTANELLSVKRIGHVGDYWIPAKDWNMETFTFQITPSQFNNLESKISSHVSPFEALVVMIWQCIAKIRVLETRTVTICRRDSENKKDGILSNRNQMLSVVKADFSVEDADLTELAALIINQSVDENTDIEESMERDQGKSDFVVYGANLTFVDLADSELYELELNGARPVFANYTVDGVGNGGVVLVLPGPKNTEEENHRGRTLTVILPEYKATSLRNELERRFNIV